ncbi:MAG: rhomboid family intramembrane serine protease [Pseudomonadota bacterium]
MLILPHSTDLTFSKRPYVTYAVIILCLFIYYLQEVNDVEIYDQVTSYCESIYVGTDSLDLLTTDEDSCVSIMYLLHKREGHGAFDVVKKGLLEDYKAGYTDSDIATILVSFHTHLNVFRQLAPNSITDAMMHFPNEINPIPMVTSALAHADWSHVIFNLIFFIAFAPAIEVLINNKLRYIGLLVSLAIVTSFSYALSILITGNQPLPSMGLSGVVMGMIGMSAYLMPKARIKVFVWFIVIVKNFYIPAWILAAWYIGWDTWEMLTSDDYGGVDVVAHVSGGIAGYIFGILWFKDIKKNTKDELADEIEYRSAERISGSSFATYSGGRHELRNRQQAKEFKKKEDNYMSELHRYVRARQDSNAITLMLKDYEIQSASPVIFEDLFDRMKLWGDSRTLLCLGRLVINALVQQRKHARALLYVEQCQAVSDEFVLADPRNVLLLASIARDNHQYQVAYLLVRDAHERYGEYIDYGQCVLIELDLLMNYLDKQDEARVLIKEQLNVEGNPIKKELMLLFGVGV